jgi:hypothetical protein
VLILDEPAGRGVVATEPNLGAARQRPTLGPGLLAGDIGQYRVPLGGGIEFQHSGRGEPVDDLVPQPDRHSGSDEQSR